MLAARLLATVASALLAIGAAAQGTPAPSRIVAMSDVHGAYDRFVELLRAASLVDASTSWTGGNAALVVVGDVPDRGDGTRRVLELLMRLEAAAPKDGGRVQLVLGNHEVMNLTGELGYVSAEGFTILLSIQFLGMIIIGGLGSVMGTLLGTAFMVLLPEGVQLLSQTAGGVFPALTEGLAFLKEGSIGLAIVLFLIFEPDGLAHRWRMIKAYWKLYPFSY